MSQCQQQTAVSSLHCFITALLQSASPIWIISLLLGTRTEGRPSACEADWAGICSCLHRELCSTRALAGTGRWHARNRHKRPHLWAESSRSRILMGLKEHFGVLPRPPPTHLAAHSEPTTVIITTIIIILIRTSDLSKYCAEASHISSCKAAKRASSWLRDCSTYTASRQHLRVSISEQLSD